MTNGARVRLTDGVGRQEARRVEINGEAPGGYSPRDVLALRRDVARDRLELMMDVLLVEDQPQVLAGLRRVIDAPGTGMRVVGAFERGGDALRWIEGSPSVSCALVDLGLPDRPGGEVLAALRRRHPSCIALAFTVFDDDEHLFPALQAGAHGYLLKDSTPAQLLEALREAVSGGAPMSPTVARRVVSRFWEESSQGGPTRAPGWEPDGTERDVRGGTGGGSVPGAAGLTAREREVLDHLCRGASYETAATTLHVSLSTVQAHVRSIYRKLGVHSKAEAVSAAVRGGLYTP